MQQPAAGVFSAVVSCAEQDLHPHLLHVCVLAIIAVGHMGSSAWALALN
jgi:hypothetical protein